MTEEFKPKPLFTIEDLETLKVVADPLRTQILELLTVEPLTVKQVAERLGLTASKLYYHVNMLEKHGLIRVVSTRVIANVIEKQYRAEAVDYDVAPALLSFSSESGQANINTLVQVTIDATRDDILRSFQARAFDLGHGAPAQPRRVVLSRQLSRIPEDMAEAFRDRLEALVREFSAADEAGAATQTHALTIAFYPSFYFPEESSGVTAPPQ